MQNLKGKRLLLLGGNLWKDAISQFAKDNGIIVIVAGNDPTSGLFDIADERYDINTTDDEAMKMFIKEKRIDGVYLGGNETVISHACKYVSDLGLPCYCTENQWNILQNKRSFKSLCEKHGLPVVPSYNITDDNIDANADTIDFPVITKPEDGCGSDGFTVCQNKNDLLSGYSIAKVCSASGKVIVEKFVKNDAVCVLYQLSEGKLHYTGTEDKYPVHYVKQGSFVGGMYLFESPYGNYFRERYEEKIQELCNDINLKEGFLWLEVFCDGNEFFFNEAGFRTGGEVTTYPADFLYGINPVASDIYYALTGESKIWGYNSAINISKKRKRYYGIYAIHLRPGKISFIDGVEELRYKDNIIAFLTAKRVGSEIADSGTFGQIFALVHITFDDASELKDTIKLILKKIIIKDTNGGDMVHTMLNIDDFDTLRTFKNLPSILNKCDEKGSYINDKAVVKNCNVGLNVQLWNNTYLVNDEFGDGCVVREFVRTERSKFLKHNDLQRYSMIYDSEMGPYSYCGKNFTCWHAKIGAFCSISWNVSIGGANHDYTRVTTHSFLYSRQFGDFMPEGYEGYDRFDAPCEIGNDVWIGCGAIICRGVNVGNGSVIAAGAVVTKDVPPYAIVAGVPAKVIKYRFPEYIRKQLVGLNWWNLPEDVIKDNFDLFNSQMDEDAILRIKELCDKCLTKKK